MWQKEKLIAKLMNSQNNITIEDITAILGYFGYYRSNKGKTNGSRIMFVNPSRSDTIMFHAPHPQKELKAYQVKQIVEHLKKEGLL